MIRDEEREGRKQDIDTLPNDIEATYWSVRNLLEDKNLRNQITKKALYYQNLNR